MNTETEPKKREFSKIIFVCIAVFVLAITVFACIVVWRTNDTAPLTQLILGAFAELATATGFYYSKAKAENKIKLMKASGVKPEAHNFDT